MDRQELEYNGLTMSEISTQTPIQNDEGCDTQGVLIESFTLQRYSVKADGRGRKRVTMKPGGRRRQRGGQVSGEEGRSGGEGGQARRAETAEATRSKVKPERAPSILAAICAVQRLPTEPS